MIKSISSVKDLESGIIYSLPRGGYIAKTSQGLLQVVSPPETIKDSLLHIKDVPLIYCIHERLFSFTKGISLAELEFPIYYNFFIKKKKTIIIGNKQVCETYKKVIKLILFGEGLGSLEKDYPPDTKLQIPNIKKEISFFLNYSFNDVLDFIVLDDNEVCQLKNLVIRSNNDGFIITDKVDGSEYTLKIPGFFPYQYFYSKEDSLSFNKIFFPPLYGLTCLGASHGFDPFDNTSGFIFWVNGSGIMVDPPVNTTDILHKSGIPPSAIDTVVLTHIHADHDSGLFQKILEESRIKVYTTQTIIELWLTKYSLLSSISVNKIKKLFDFIPVVIDKPLNIKGVEFNFRYMIHSIPTIGFTMKMKEKSITFSSDHLNEPTFFKKIYEHNFIEKERYDELMNFPWDSDLIYHEAGIPPLHTPVSYLDSLSLKIKQKTFLYHISEEDVPPETTLTRCKSGVNNSVSYNLENDQNDEENKLIGILSNVYLFKRFKIKKEKIKDLISSSNNCQTLKLSPHQPLIGNNLSEKILVVISGYLSINSKEDLLPNNKRVLPKGQLITGDELARDGSVIIKSLCESELLIIDKSKFLEIIYHPQIVEWLTMRSSLDIQAWEVVEGCELFNCLTLAQTADFVNLLTPIIVEKIPYKFSPNSDIIFIHSASCHDGKKTINPQIGKILGHWKGWVELPSYSPTIAAGEVVEGLVYLLEKEEIDFFYMDNPGLCYRFTYADKIRESN